MKLLENSSLILDMVGEVASLSSVVSPVVEVESTCRGSKVVMIVFKARPWRPPGVLLL